MMKECIGAMVVGGKVSEVQLGKWLHCSTALHSLCHFGRRMICKTILRTFVQSAPTSHPSIPTHQVLVVFRNAHWNDVWRENHRLVKPARAVLNHTVIGPGTYLSKAKSYSNVFGSNLGWEATIWTFLSWKVNGSCSSSFRSNSPILRSSSSGLTLQERLSFCGSCLSCLPLTSQRSGLQLWPSFHSRGQRRICAGRLLKKII